MTEGIVLTGLFGLLDAYLFRGASSRLAVDAIKGAYGKLRHRSWEDLYLDAFRQALDESAELLRRYGAADGEIVLSDKQLKDALTCDLDVDPAKLSEATLTSGQFGRGLAAALARRQALVIGGNNLAEADYVQVVARLVERAQSIFTGDVLENEAAFRNAVLVAAREAANRDRTTQANVEEVERVVDQVDAFLRDRFDLVLTKLDQIQQDVQDTKEAVGRLSSPAVPTALNYLPPPPDDFVGRGRETQRLLTALRSGGATISGAAKAGVAGMAGVGKTALALYVAQQVAAEYETHVYLDLKGTANPPPSPTDVMLSVVRAFDLSLDTSRLTADDIKRLYFSQLHGKRALLVLDNAADAWQVEPLLPGQGCAVLVTSRRAFVLAGLKPLPLGVLPPGKARALLLKICPRIGAAATDLAELCGRLPLALRLAASHLAARPPLLVDEYLESLRERQTRLAALRSPGHPDLDVEAAFELSYDCLGAPDQERWRALAVFPSPFDALAVAAVWGLDEPAARGLLAEVVRVSMVEYDEAGERYHLHDLLASFAEARLSTEESMEGQRRHARHFLGVAAAANGLYRRGGQDTLAGLRLFDAEWPHIRAGQAWAAGNAARDDDAADMVMRYPFAGAHWLDLRLRSKERAAWYETAAANARRLGDRGLEGAALGNLGIAYLDLGQAAQAVEHHRQALSIARETGDRSMEGNALGNLGIAYLALGQAAKAVEHHQQALAISREIGDQRAEGADLGNLGNGYLVLGQAAKAVEHHQQALVILRQIGNAASTCMVLRSLGELLSSRDSARAEEVYREALAVDPADHWNYLGIVLLLRQQGREREAVPLLMKRSELAPDNPNPAMALASIYRQLGDVALSSSHAGRARELLKPDDGYRLACLESVCGKTEAAVDNLRRAAGEPDFDAAWAWENWDLQWIRDDPRFAEIVGPKPGTMEGDR